MGWFNSQIRRLFPAIALAPAALIVLSPSGCASDVPRREELAWQPSSRGPLAEAVFLPPAHGDPAQSPDLSGPEFGRRDFALAGESSQPLLATTEWPQPARTTLERPRYIHIRDDARRFIYFLPERSHSEHRWWFRNP